MKILDLLLNEDVGAAMAYKNLSPLQVGLLKKIATGNFDVDQASPQAQDAVNGLVSFGLVDDLITGLTDKGDAALALAQKYGSFERQKIASRPQQQTQQQQVPDDDTFVDDDDSFEIN